MFNGSAIEPTESNYNSDQHGQYDLESNQKRMEDLVNSSKYESFFDCGNRSEKSGIKG